MCPDEYLLSQQKPASLSTRKDEWYASYAFDGKLGQDPKLGHKCALTSNLKNGWLKVDLEHIAFIYRIVIYNLQDNHTYKAKNFIIYVANSQNMLVDKQICTTFERITTVNQIQSFDCQPSTKGRYVQVTNDDSVQLRLCEVQVIGHFAGSIAR